MRPTPLLFAVLFGLCCAAPAAAGAAGTVSIAHATQPPSLDPSLNDPAWQAGRITLHPAFTDLTTRRAAPATTTVYVLYDDRTLYVAFRAEQPAQAIVAGQTTHGVGFGIDDFVGIGIDPGTSGSQVYYFETTPRGTRYQQANENARYAPLWAAAGRTEPGAWNAVMAIPLAALRLHAGTQHWRINFIRGVAATGEHLTWAYDPLMNDGPVGNGWPSYLDVRFWPYVQPFALAKVAGAARTPRADIFALGSVGRDRDQFQQADQQFLAEKPRAYGIDAAIPVTDTITFVGTLNPDFSNVEIDQQTIAPQEFRRQLLEYRPFFAQGAAFLNPNPYPTGVTGLAPPDVIFYSPSIGPFDRGFKVEGTHGNDSFGVLSVRGYDLTTSDLFDDVAYGFHHALPDRTFQYWADGVLAHHSAAGSDETNEFGFSGRNLGSGLVYTADTAIEQGSANGGAEHSTSGFVDLHKPNYELNAGYEDVSPRYNPIDGFTADDDIRGPNVALNLLGNGTRVKNWILSLFGDRYQDDSGAVHQADAAVLLNAAFKNGFSIDGSGPDVGELRTYAVPSGPHCGGAIAGRSAFGGAPCYLDGQTSRFDLFTAAFGYRDGTPAPVDWSYAYGPFGDNELHEFTTTTSRPIGRRLSLTLEYDGSWERSLVTGQLDSQFLRRIGLGASLGPNANVSLALRSINGTGGFALPGTNVAASFHRHWNNGDDLYLDFGTPAATKTLDRFIAKYVLHVGPLPGT
ncbi:MAG TPA: hypothetical protein VHT05_10390 [Candidatus Elarobacter sp.]|jgi:hypothetical protein|nr:hypothetical protein [Candidatus Elarobacter sp.]